MKMLQKQQTAVITAFLMFITSAFSLFPVPEGSRITINGFLDWQSGEIEAVTELDITSIGIRFPSGRIQAEEILKDEYLGLVKPILLSIQADSSSTVEDLVLRGDLAFRQLDEICLAASKVTPYFSIDLTRFSGRYSIKLGSISSTLIRHRQPGEPGRPLVPTPAANYTGIIIIADTPLPIHGRNSSALLQPCLFPKIWDDEMNLIYERNLTDPALTGTGEKPMVHYTNTQNIFRPTPSGIDDKLVSLVGDRPLRIFASSVFGIVPTDPVINRADALLILSNENNRGLLREGRVVFVINDDLLKFTF